MRKIIGFRTLCVGLGIWGGLLGYLLRVSSRHYLGVKVPLIILI